MSTMRIAVQGHLQVIRIPGDLRAPVRDLPRGAEVVYEGRNLVVNTGLQVFSRMLGNNIGAIGSLTSDWTGPVTTTFGAISEIAVGTMSIGGTPSPSTPNANDTAVSATPARSYNASVINPYQIPQIFLAYPDDYSVTFSGVVGAPYGNTSYGYITQEALYLRNGLLFARVNLTPQIPKDASFSLQFNHTISLASFSLVPAVTSALAVTAVNAAPFTYTITATNSPTTFGASGLPSWLTLNPATGVITNNTTTVAGVYTVTLFATNASFAGSATLVITIT